jgi:hypothetical protein
LLIYDIKLLGKGTGSADSFSERTVSDDFQIETSDLLVFREATRDEARRLFSEFQHTFPNETFYIFALFDYVDWSCPSLFYSANTLQHWKDALSQQANAAVGLPAEFYKWSAGPWKCDGPLSSMRVLEDIMAKTGIEDLDDYDQIESARQALRLSIEVEMILALRELDAEGLFGQGEKRKEFLLTVSTEDEGALDDWLYEISACLLNPDEVFRRFLVEFRRGNRQELPDMEACIQQLRDTDVARRFQERLAL